MKKFVETDKYGQLYIDRILFESYFPVLFTCQNSAREIFICVCCQNNAEGCKWLVGKTEGKNIISMLKDEITIRELFLERSSGKISVDYVNGEYTVEYNNSDWNEESVYLPKKGSYIAAEKGEFDEDILYFSALNSVYYDTNLYRYVSKASATVSKDGLSVAEIPNNAATVFGNIMIPSTIVSTLEFVGKFCIDLSLKSKKYETQETYDIVYDSSFNAAKNDLGVVVNTNDSSMADAA